jgi:hypothetical protein
MKKIIKEKEIRLIVKSMLLEYKASDIGIISGDQGDPYTYKIEKATSDSIVFKVISKNGKKINASFTVNQKNKNKAGVKKLLNFIKSDLEKFKKIPGVEKSIKNLTSAVGDGDTKKDNAGSKESTSDKESQGSTPARTGLEGLNYTKNWDELDVKSWVNSKEDSVRAIKYKQKEYFSWGFVIVPGEKERKPESGLAVLVPYKTYREMLSELGPSKIKLIAQDKAVKGIKPKSGNYKLKTKKGDVPVLIKSGAAGIKLGTYEFDSGAPLTAEAAVLALDIIGAIPVIGAVGDGANVIVQLSMKPPLYFGAVLSAVGAVPAIGELAALFKVAKSVNKIADGIIAGKALSRVVSDAIAEIGEGSLRSTLKGKTLAGMIVESKEGVFKFLGDNASKLDTYIDGFSDVIFPQFKKFFNKLVEVYLLIKSLPHTRLTTEIKKWKSLIARGQLKIVGQAEEKALDIAFEESGIYESFGVKEKNIPFADKIEKLADAIPKKYTDLNIDQELAFVSLEKLSPKFAA